MTRHAFSVLAYALTTFATQAVSHFIVNAQHYAAVGHMRGEPLFPLGILPMLIQGGVLSYLYSRSDWAQRSIFGSLRFGWLMGSFLVSYVALAEAAKYTVPAVPSWVAMEAAAGFVQFTLYGALLGLVHVRQQEPRAAAAT